MNGRVNGDQWGNFTHSNKNCGESTIDLAIVSDALFPHITDLKVLPLNAYSDHSKIILAIDNVLLPPAKKTDYNWVNLKKGYTWEKIENKLLNAMRTPPILTKIQQCKQFLDAGLIESSGKTIQDIFTLAADIASKEVDSNPKPTKKQLQTPKTKQKWYDQECKILKNMSISLLTRETNSFLTKKLN